MSFEKFRLFSPILHGLEACGFALPTAIQNSVIPPAMEGRDVAASAQTGTGKTAAFVVPLLQRLAKTSQNQKPGCPRALILTPTRELAQQVEGQVRLLGRFCRVDAGAIVGGEPYGPQIRMLRRNCDIIVATPGRLIDHMERKNIDLSGIGVLVLDEADRMLDMGFLDSVTEIASAIPADRQSLLFSATLEGKVELVARRILRDPLFVRLTTNRDMHSSITQKVFHADSLRHKNSLLTHLLQNGDLEKAIIFTSTKRGAEKLAKNLTEIGHSSASLHGDMGQNARKRTIDALRRGNPRFMVATDVAARGLDIDGVTHVINFDLPMVAEDYIHRIGRTGRAGAKGVAISLVGPEDRPKLASIERLTGQKIRRETIPGLGPQSRKTPCEHTRQNDGLNSRRKSKNIFAGYSKTADSWDSITR